MGPWASANPMPSCLGMLNQMAAYASLTGAPYLVGSVQRIAAEQAMFALEQLFGDAYKWAEARLPAGFCRDGLPGKLQNRIREVQAYSNVMITRREFHGVLLIGLSDRRWAVVDPYMHNLSCYDPTTRPIGSIYSGVIMDPGSAVHVNGLKRWGHLPVLTKQLQEVYGIIDHLLELPHDTPLIGLASRLHQLAKDHVGITLAGAEDILRYCCTQPPDHEPPPLDDARVILANLSTDRSQTEVRERLLMALLNAWAQLAYNMADKTRSSEPHTAITLTNPSRTLALWTLLSLRRRLNARVLGADLIRVSKCEVALYSALLDRRRGHTDPDEDALIDRRLAETGELSPCYVHPLLLDALTWKTRRGNNGKSK